MDRESITSLQNSKVKQIRRLRERRNREHEGRFVIDEARDLARALACDYTVDYAFYAPQLATAEDTALLHILDRAGALIYETNRDVMTKANYRQNPGGLLAVLHSPEPLDAAKLQTVTDWPLLALVDLRKPGNIGALLRTADATGFRTILLVDTPLDIYNPNIIRSSTGACFLSNIYTLNTAEALAYFRARELSIVAAVVEGDRDLYQVDFSQPCAIALGTEDTGLNDDWINAADQQVRIPMVGRLSDSLNVSVSGAMFMYEALRQDAV